MPSGEYGPPTDRGYWVDPASKPEIWTVEITIDDQVIDDAGTMTTTAGNGLYEGQIIQTIVQQGKPE